MYSQCFFFISNPDTANNVVQTCVIILVIGMSPILLHGILYMFYVAWQTVYNTICAWLGKPVQDIIEIDEFGMLGVILRARRKQKIEQANSVCDMLNSRTEILSDTFEHYGLTLISVRIHPDGIHPYNDSIYKVACDLEIKSGDGTELRDNVYIHVCLFDDNDIEVERIDIIIKAYGFSGHAAKHERFNIYSDSVPTHMKVYVDRHL